VHRESRRWRNAGWGAAGLLVLLPFLAMQLTDEVAWSPADFVLAALLIGGAGLAWELAARKARGRAYRAAAGVALAASIFLVWVNGAVGIIGSEDNPANLMHGGVLAVGVVGAAFARSEPTGMARALWATALAQALVPLLALAAGADFTGSGPLEIVAITALFAAFWLASALLFKRAARA
jgi:hypothetical protein